MIPILFYLRKINGAVNRNVGFSSKQHAKAARDVSNKVSGQQYVVTRSENNLKSSAPHGRPRSR